MKKLRSDNARLNIINETPGVEHLDLNSVRLPTWKQVLLCHMANTNKLRIEDPSKHLNVKKSAAKLVASKVMNIYEKASIPCMMSHKVSEKTENLQKEFYEINKKRNSQRIEKFQLKIEETMPFWTKDAAEEMRGTITPLTNESNKKEIERDISFLQSMQTDRVATMGAFDKTN